MECRQEENVRSDIPRAEKDFGTEQRFPGLSGSALKWIAIFTMLLDHLGACVIEVYILNGRGTSPYKGFWRLPNATIDTILFLDEVLRGVGRIAFPIFCFLLVEGFCHTRDVKKYALRLGIFCLISEVPFDLAFLGSPVYLLYQNVFFTLLLGLLGIWALQYFTGEKRFLGTLIALALAILAGFLHTDYATFGVVFIEVLYLLRERKALRTAAGILCLVLYGGTEVIGALAFIPISLYNGTRGRQPKYFFYVFYPAHLLLLVAVGRILIPYLLG